MQFKFYHDPNKKTLVVPRIALQLSGLAKATEVKILTEGGCVLLTRNDLTTAETVGIIAMLTEICDKLIDQLAEETQEAADDDGDEEDRVYPLMVGNSLLAEAGISPHSNLKIEAGDGRIVITGRGEDVNDPLLRYDDEFLAMLQAYEVDLNGLRFLLECESADDE